MPDTLTLNCSISEKDHGLPLIKMLTRRFPYHGREGWLAEISRGALRLNGNPASPETITRSGDLLEYQAADFREPEVPLEWEKVLETPDLVLAGKSAGTPVTRTGLIVQNTFVNILSRHHGQRIYPLHRLDRETGGLLLCAKNRETCQQLQKRLPEVIVNKYYLAIIRGKLEAKELVVDEPLATRPDTPVRCRMQVVEGGKPCRTIFTTIGRIQELSLLLAEPVTGRKHQIRAHLAHLGHPLVGDKIYSHDGEYFLKRLEQELDDEDYRRLGARNHILHAWAIQLRLPGKSPELFFSSNFSPDLQSYLAMFPGWQKKAVSLLSQLPR